MSSDVSRNGFNREYISVRQLISVLTNDHSDRMIVEKLKGKNLSSLLYNAKIIDNSKNMTANKRILACVIRAIEREKKLCCKRDPEQSWGRKFLNSFNCLYPGMNADDDAECAQNGKPSHKAIKNRTQSRHKKISSARTTKIGCKNGIKNKRKSTMNCDHTTAQSENPQPFRKAPTSSIDDIRDKPDIGNDCIVAHITEDTDHALVRKNGEVLQQMAVICPVKFQNRAFETIHAPLLQQQKLNCVVVYPRGSLPAVRTTKKARKNSSYTQTLGNSNELDFQMLKEPNNIKLQDLLEAATSLINTPDQREYVRSFLTNCEPPFDLLAGFPPYLKLPMKKSEDLGGKESVYGSNSEASLLSTAFQATNDRRTNDQMYVRHLGTDPWQDTADSIISGVINESLPRDKANYSHLSACILKRLGAYPGTTPKDNKHQTHILNIPEIILQCTEFFESDAGDSDNNPQSSNAEPMLAKSSKVDESACIVEMNLINDMESESPWNGYKKQNYCFLSGDSASTQKASLLNLSERSLVDIEHGQGDASQDRKNLLLREPLKITPSGLEQGQRKINRMTECKWENKNKEQGDFRQMSAKPSYSEEEKRDDKNNDEEPTLEKYTGTLDKKHKLSSELEKHKDGSGENEIMSIMTTTPKSTTDDYMAGGPIACSSHTETPPPEMPDDKVENFDGVGEGEQQLTEPAKSKADHNQQTNKKRNVQEQNHIKNKSGKKTHSDKSDSTTCNVM